MVVEEIQSYTLHQLGLKNSHYSYGVDFSILIELDRLIKLIIFGVNGY